MFGSMKTTMAAVAVGAVMAMAPAVASADQWTINGSTAYTGTAVATGTLTLTAGSGATTTCTVRGTLSLTNPGSVAAGSVTGFLLGAPAGGTCTTTIPNCAVTAAASSIPWTLSTSGTNATIGGIGFTNTYTNNGGTCALAGIPVNASGSLTGAVSSNVLTLTNAGPLTTTVGPATVSGAVSIRDTGGNAVSLF